MARRREVGARFAAEAGVPLPHTIAVGATLPVLRAAGMAIGFDPHPAVRDIADTTITTLFLDSILFLLGIPPARRSNRPTRPEPVGVQFTPYAARSRLSLHCYRGRCDMRPPHDLPSFVKR